jgi:hypothetical protein
MRTGAHKCRIYLHLAAMYVACAIFCLATAASAQQPSTKVQGYTEIRRFSQRSPTQYLAMSADGSTAVGFLNSSLDNWYDFYRWSRSGGTDELAGIKGKDRRPQTVSANGEVLAGSVGSLSNHVFVWSRSGGTREIANAGIHYPKVSFVSNDASVVVWVEYKGKFTAPDARLMRWSKSGGVKELGKTGTDFSVTGVSADGSEIVGYSGAGNQPGQGFRWSQQGGWEVFLPMEAPLAISADGRTILGLKSDRVIRWTQAGGAQDLGPLNASTVIAYKTTASVEGTTIVGRTLSGHGFLWTQSGGAQDLGSMGGQSASLDAVSADGKVVAGDFLDLAGTTVHFVSSVADLVAKVQGAEKQEQARVQAQAAAQAEAQKKAAAAKAEQQAKKAAAAADQQARYDKVMKTGRPAQIYALAGHMEDEGRADLAANLYQALIDKFPDDPYTAKAIDKEDAVRAAAAQQQQQAQDAANNQPAAADAVSPQAIEACHQECSATLTSCKGDAQNQHASAVAKGLVGLLSKNAASVSGAASDVQDADSALAACNDAYNSCSAACQ